MSAGAPRTIVVVIGAVDDATRDEAFRAAVGLSLRGGRVHVAITDGNVTLGPAAQRARALLELMGHSVEHPGAEASRLARADVVEVWGPVDLTPAPAHPDGAAAPATASRRTHLVRPGRRAAFPTAGEPVLHLPPVLSRDAADRLLDQLLAGDRLVVW